jgi:uncharacterized short protein YbdD (DUF466 family)
MAAMRRLGGAAVTAPGPGPGGEAPPAGAPAGFAAFLRCVCDGARMVVGGVPSYDAYVAHMRRTHPEAPVMTYAEFFRARQDARYGAGGGGGGLRCC